MPRHRPLSKICMGAGFRKHHNHGSRKMEEPANGHDLPDNEAIPSCLSPTNQYNSGVEWDTEPWPGFLLGQSASDDVLSHHYADS